MATALAQRITGITSGRVSTAFGPAVVTHACATDYLAAGVRSGERRRSRQSTTSASKNDGSFAFAPLAPRSHAARGACGSTPDKHPCQEQRPGTRWRFRRPRGSVHARVASLMRGSLRRPLPARCRQSLGRPPGRLRSTPRRRLKREIRLRRRLRIHAMALVTPLQPATTARPVSRRRVRYQAR
jgi:hypothetical protein